MIEKDGPKVKVIIISQDKFFVKSLKRQFSQHNRFLYSYRKRYTMKGTPLKITTFEQAEDYIEYHRSPEYQSTCEVYFDIIGEYSSVKAASLHYKLSEAYIVFIDKSIANQGGIENGELTIASLLHIGYSKERRLSNTSLSWISLGSEGWKKMLMYAESVFEKQVTLGFCVESWDFRK